MLEKQFTHKGGVAVVRYRAFGFIVLYSRLATTQEICDFIYAEERLS